MLTSLHGLPCYLNFVCVCVFGWGQGSGALWLSGYSSTTCQGHEVFPNPGLHVWLLGRGRLWRWGEGPCGSACVLPFAVCVLVSVFLLRLQTSFFFVNQKFPFTLTQVSIYVTNTVFILLHSWSVVYCSYMAIAVLSLVGENVGQDGFLLFVSMHLKALKCWQRCN